MGPQEDRDHTYKLFKDKYKGKLRMKRGQQETETGGGEKNCIPLEELPRKEKRLTSITKRVEVKTSLSRGMGKKGKPKVEERGISSLGGETGMT